MGYLRTLDPWLLWWCVCVGVCGWMDSLVANMGGSAWTLGAECGERNLGASLGAGDVTQPGIAPGGLERAQTFARY